MVTMAVLHFGLPVLLQVILLVVTVKASKPLCPNQCGDVVISYPFGIGEGCYFDKSFEVVCDNSSGSPETLLKSINRKLYSVYGLSLNSMTVNISVISLNTNKSTSNDKGVNLTGTPFSFSQRDNRFTAAGCDNYAKVNQQNDSSSRCLSICSCDPTKNGDRCCDLSCHIPPDRKVFDATTSYDYSRSIPLQKCHSVTMVDKDWLFEKYGDNSFILKDQEQVPVTLEWGKYKGRCYEEYDPHNKICNEDNQCLIHLGSSGHLCLCDEKSSNASKYLCAGYLFCNTTSGVDCSKCPHGYYRSGLTFNQEPACSSRNSLLFGKKSRDKFIVTGCTTGGFGMLFLLTGAWWLNKFVKRRREIKLKHKFFKRNGGLLLQKELSSYKGNIEKTKLFTSKELEKATDNFNTNRILGQGGQGTVYKGMLADGKIVAIKKSKIIDKSKVEEFINEVVLLSQINHRKVVKLLGCCLETEVPLLVYEFISNGTLSQYIHDQNEEFPITWEMRLRIAADISDAVSYLHSATSMPIYHRDIKSTNILLDDKYRAKVSDFGASRSITIDQTHMTTQVQGTFGYLDPEYFRSSHFTDKSDVYSFGVVLAELLTGEKPIRFSNSEEDKSLAAYFLCAMKEERLFEILDDHVLKEGDKDEIINVAKLAKRCLNLNGKKRPTMREVAMELTGISACNGASNIGRENVEEIDCVDDDTCESSGSDSCYSESSSSSVTISMMPIF